MEAVHVNQALDDKQRQALATLVKKARQHFSKGD